MKIEQGDDVGFGIGVAVVGLIQNDQTRVWNMLEKLSQCSIAYG